MSLSVRSLPAHRFDQWRAAAGARLQERLAASCAPDTDDGGECAQSRIRSWLPDGAQTAGTTVLLVSDGQDEGWMWLALDGDKLVVRDLVRPEGAGAEDDDELFRHIDATADREGAARIVVPLFGEDSSLRSLIEGRGFRVVSVQMRLQPVPASASAGSTGLRLTPMSADRFPRFIADSAAGFAAELLASGRYDAAGATAEAQRQVAQELPQGLDTAGQLLFTAAAHGEEVGLLWLAVRQQRNGRHVFVQNVEVAPSSRGRGYGRELMRAVEDRARRIGATSIGLHVFGSNTVAVRLYESLGYRRVDEVLLLDRAPTPGE